MSQESHTKMHLLHIEENFIKQEFCDDSFSDVEVSNNDKTCEIGLDLSDKHESSLEDHTGDCNVKGEPNLPEHEGEIIKFEFFEECFRGERRPENPATTLINFIKQECSENNFSDLPIPLPVEVNSHEESYEKCRSDNCESILEKPVEVIMHEKTYEIGPSDNCESNVSLEDHLMDTGINRNVKGDINIPEHAFSEEFCKLPSCTHTKKYFERKCQLRSHNFLSMHTQENPFQCKLCLMHFVSEDNCKQHVLRFHTGVKPFQCSVCEERFYREKDCDSHLIVHMGNLNVKGDINFPEHEFSEESFRCFRIVRTEKKYFPCDLCEMRFERECKMRSHFRRVHSGEKAFRCELCEKGFVSKYNCKRHMLRAHTGEKRFQCNVCKKRFRLMEDCKSHLRRTHRKA